MTDTTDTTTPSPDHDTSAAELRRWKRIAAVLAAATVLAIGAAAYATTRDDDQSPAVVARNVAATDHMAHDHMMMGDSPEAMREHCLQALGPGETD